MSNYNYRKTTLIIKIVALQHPLNLQFSIFQFPIAKRLSRARLCKEKGCNCNKINSLFYG